VVVDAAAQEERPEPQKGIDPLALDEIIGVIVLDWAMRVLEMKIMAIPKASREQVVIWRAWS